LLICGTLQGCSSILSFVTTAGRIIQTINSMEATEGSSAHVSLLQKGAQKLGLESAHRQRYTVGIVCVLTMAVLVIAAILCAPAAFPLQTTQSNTTKPPKTLPNVMFIMADDLGWGNVGYHNPDNQQINTPNLDDLATSGLQLERMYVYRGCSPSRSSFQTGRLPVHVSMDNGDGGITNPTHGIPADMTGFAEKLKEADYRTYLFGKWDAGFASWKQMPTNRGWDTFYGYLGKTIDYFVKTAVNSCPDMGDFDLWSNEGPAFTSQEEMGDGYIEFELRDKVFEVLDQHSRDTTDPFFIFYSSHLPHYPAQIPEEYLIDDPYDDDISDCSLGRNSEVLYPGFHGGKEDYKCRTITQSQVNLLDEIVGQIVDKLKANNLWENTLLVFQSDNGGDIALEHAAGNNFPLRGGKKTDFEGGIRAVTFLNGGVLPRRQQGKVESGLMHIADWYATFSYMAGVDPADQRAHFAGLPAPDSINMWPFLMGDPDATESPRKGFAVSDMTIIEGDFKYYSGRLLYAVWGESVWPNGDTPSQDDMRDDMLDCAFHGCLFDVAKDPEERIDVGILYPELRQQLKVKLAHERTEFWVNEVHGVERLEEDSCPEGFEMVVTVGYTDTFLDCGCWMAANNYNNFDGPYQGLEAEQKAYIPQFEHQQTDYSKDFEHEKAGTEFQGKGSRMEEEEGEGDGEGMMAEDEEYGHEQVDYSQDFEHEKPGTEFQGKGSRMEEEKEEGMVAEDEEGEQQVYESEDVDDEDVDEIAIPDESSDDLMDGDIDVDELMEIEEENEEEEFEEIEAEQEAAEQIESEMDEVREEEEDTAGFHRVSPRKAKGQEVILNGGRAKGVEPRIAASNYLNVVYLGVGILLVVVVGMCMAYTKKEEKVSTLMDANCVPASSYGTAL